MSAVLDPGVLRDLGDDLGDGTARWFAECYRSMLPGRVARLQQLVAVGDAQGAYVAALSLHSSSAMVGAAALAARAEALAAGLRRQDLTPANAARDQLTVLAEETAAALLSMFVPGVAGREPGTDKPSR